MRNRFHLEELQRFLRLVDAELSAPCSLTVVGDCAVALGYCPEHAITDIEVWSASDRVIWSAAERASEKIARPIHLRQVLVGPRRGLSLESRLRPVKVEGTRLLTVLVPEAHDLAALYAAAPADATLAAVAELHKVQALTLKPLLECHEELRGSELVSEVRSIDGLLALVRKLFGSAKAEEIERRMKRRPTQPRPTPHGKRGG